MYTTGRATAGSLARYPASSITLASRHRQQKRGSWYDSRDEGGGGGDGLWKMIKYWLYTLEMAKCSSERNGWDATRAVLVVTIQLTNSGNAILRYRVNQKSDHDIRIPLPPFGVNAQSMQNKKIMPMCNSAQ